MSIKATSVLRSAALLGVAVAALAMAPAAMAIDQGFAPRPDFPGAKQSQNNAKTTKTHQSASKRHAQHMHGKRHTSYRGAYSRVGAAAAGAAVAPNYGYGYGNNYGYGNYYGGYWGPPPIGAPVAQNYNYGYGNYGYRGYFGPTSPGNAAAQDARLAQNPAALRALRQNFARER
jgi:hypothetical protein